jgi:hypothetical protein
MNHVDAKPDSAELQAHASILSTEHDLKTVAQSLMIGELSTLSLPEIEAVVDVVARVIPAGNVPGVILNGLARLSGRKPPPDIVKRDVNLLFKGVEKMLDRAVYGAFFAGPAAVIWGYQNLLKLAGKHPDDSFPDGTWQFYVEYALREDTARHANETHGFDTRLNQYGVRLSAVDRIVAWVMTAIHTLHQYPNLLTNEWRERVYCHLLAEIAAELEQPTTDQYAGLYRQWQGQIPFSRGADAQADESYPAYRKRRFDDFFEAAIADHPQLHRHWLERVRQAKEEELERYLAQMDILAYLDPGTYSETRTAIPLKKAQIAVIHRGRYTLIPACERGTDRPADVHTVRGQVAALVADPPDAKPGSLRELPLVRRVAQAGLRKQFSDDLVKELDRLRLAPILINCDRQPADRPLAELRLGERGVGDHPLTLFDTGETMIFDQSHIFFDGGWGAALAEIMTNEALSWARYLHALPPATPAKRRPYSPALRLTAADRDRVLQAPRITPEVAAESAEIDLKRLLALRKMFKQRSDLLRLTVNDLLVLFRAIHAVRYTPSTDLLEELEALLDDEAARDAAQAALTALEASRQTNPAILIPVDASQRSPRDRLHPMSFEVPLADLDLLALHTQTIEALSEYQSATGDRSAVYAEFDRLQHTYLATLAGFGEVMSKAKEIANAGESASVGSIKLLAHMPTPLQQLLDKIPGRFDMLNDIIKGREVFSNVGVVAPTSTLTRFITAKDDNEKKTLAWGVVTDADGVMRISLRDFRPHVGLLIAAGERELATRLAQDYLNAYAWGFNLYIRELQRITRASRETRLARQEEHDER